MPVTSIARSLRGEVARAADRPESPANGQGPAGPHAATAPPWAGRIAARPAPAAPPAQAPLPASTDRSAAAARESPVPPSPALCVAAARLPQAAARQNIASYAHLKGVVLTHAGRPVGTVAPATLCRILREAIEATREGRRERVETLIRAIALGIIRADGAPLPVPRAALDTLRWMGLGPRLARGNPVPAAGS